MSTPPDDLFGNGNSLVRQLQIAMIRLDAKADNLMNRLNEVVTRFDERNGDHEQRIRKLEERDYVSPATVWKIVTLICTLAGIALTIISLTK